MKQRYIELLPFPKLEILETVYVGTNPTSGDNVLGVSIPQPQENISFEKN